jgi:hypothetical protein
MAVIILGVMATGCQSAHQPAVIAVTGTNFGLDIAQNPATQTPHMKLGYNRGEVALVSKGKFGTENDVANVVMEFKYTGGSGENSGIYQRLAVGKAAVTGTGATAMFLKNADGNLSENAIKNAMAAREAISD